MTFGLGINIVFFFGMGLLALMRPRHVVALVEIRLNSGAARNEVRAVYGGFGLAIAGLLLASVWLPAWRSGIQLSVAVALLGMAAGRVISFLCDGIQRWPAYFFVGECTLAALLLATMTTTA